WRRLLDTPAPSPPHRNLHVWDLCLGLPSLFQRSTRAVLRRRLASGPRKSLSAATLPVRRASMLAMVAPLWRRLLLRAYRRQFFPAHSWPHAAALQHRHGPATINRFSSRRNSIAK